MEYFRAGTPNYSGWTIPAYYALSFVPHLWSCGLLIAPASVGKSRTDGKVKPGQLIYNNSNPRGASTVAKYESILDKSTITFWERLRASHNNMLESSGFVVSAFAFAFITKVPSEDMNLASVIYLASRVLYLYTYLGVERGAATYFRTVWFFVGIAAIASLWFKSAVRISEGKY